MARPGIWHLLKYHKPLPIRVYQNPNGAEIHLKSRVDQKWQLYRDLRFIAKARRKTIVLSPGRVTMYSDDTGFIDFNIYTGYTRQRPEVSRPDMSVEEVLSIINEFYRSMFE